MKTKRMTRPMRIFSRCGLLCVLSLFQAGCGPILGQPEPERIFYVLEVPACKPAEAGVASTLPELLVADPLASTLVNSQRILFGRNDGTRGSYQLAAWTEPPPRRFALLMIDRLGCSGLFSAVTRKSTLTGARFLLNSEIIDLYHDISVTPGEARVAVRMELVDLVGRKIVADRTFERKVPVASFDANGAIDAMRDATARVLDDTAAWLVENRALLVKSEESGSLATAPGVQFESPS
jgi:ABC-type uncharacterized transport system auxiliary subunit